MTKMMKLDSPLTVAPGILGVMMMRSRSTPCGERKSECVCVGWWVRGGVGVHEPAPCEPASWSVEVREWDGPRSHPGVLVRPINAHGARVGERGRGRKCWGSSAAPQRRGVSDPFPRPDAAILSACLLPTLQLLRGTRGVVAGPDSNGQMCGRRGVGYGG